MMKETMRMVILHTVVGVLFFVGALTFFNYRISAEKGNPVTELQNSTYPVMEIGSAVSDYNVMSAYRNDVDLSLVRDQVTVVDHSGTLELKLHNYDYDITAIQYVLFESTPDEPLEEGTVNQLTDNEEENVRTGTLTFEHTLEQGKNFYLQLAVRLDNSTRVYFYTKVQNGAGYNLEEYFTYALKFHDNLFDKTKMEENASYLEPTAGVSSSSLEYVDIHSSTEAVFFGSMEVRQVSEPRIKVREINDTYAVLELDTVLSSEVRDGVVQYYDVSETYRMRYTAERMYLLDYQRTMDAYYNEEIIDSADSCLSLGIQNEDNVEYISSAEGHKLAFSAQGQLWYYNYDDSDVTQVYSFSSENLADVRNDQDEHGIKILDFDDDGNILYLVYGYISRGRHEGDNGIQIMRYDAATSCNEELAFLISSIPYSSMREDIEKLAYLNSDNIFYCVLDGDLHEIDLEEKTDEILVSGMINESLTASADKSIIAIEKETDIWNNTEIQMTDLESGKTQTFTCGENERIRSIGFLSNDFIYGIANTADVSAEASGAVTFPVKEIRIMDIDGNEVRNYKQKNRYILETNISGSVLEMTLGRKNGKNFRASGGKDYIRYKEESREDSVSLISKYSGTFGEQLYFKFPEYVYIQIEPDLIPARILASEDDASLELSRSGNAVRQYFVYADGETAAAYTSLSEAVNAAVEARGNVIDSREKVVWECVFDDYAIVAGMDDVTKVSGDGRSLAGCLSMIARVNGTNVAAGSIDTKAGSVEELLSEYSRQETLNLIGCSLDDVLYYISKGSPVLARYTGGRYVIVMSYNSTKIRYLDPVTGVSTVGDRSQITENFRKAGNVFYSYLAQ